MTTDELERLEAAVETIYASNPNGYDPEDVKKQVIYYIRCGIKIEDVEAKAKLVYEAQKAAYMKRHRPLPEIEASVREGIRRMNNARGRTDD